MTPPTPTGAWSLDRLVTSLARAGWGETLDGPALAGVRKVLQALSDLLPWEAAEGRLTRAQVADAAGMTPKWAGVCLARLEALGIITWHRGWLDKGRPRAGWIRVAKVTLASLVRGARGWLDARRAQRREQTRERISNTLRRTSVPPWRSKPRSGDMGTEFHPSHSRKYGAPAPGRPSPLPTLPTGDNMPACAVCGRSQDACERAAKKEPFAIQHQYEPSIIGQRRTLIAPTHELRRPPTQKQQRDGWRTLARQAAQPAHPTLDLES